VSGATGATAVHAVNERPAEQQATPALATATADE
jgi:hypothetical protein